MQIMAPLLNKFQNLPKTHEIIKKMFLRINLLDLLLPN